MVSISFFLRRLSLPAAVLTAPLLLNACAPEYGAYNNQSRQPGAMAYYLPKAVMDVSVELTLTACDAGYGPLALTPAFFSEAEAFLPIYVSGRVVVSDDVKRRFNALKADFQQTNAGNPAQNRIPDSWFVQKRDDRGVLEPVFGFSGGVSFVADAEHSLRHVPDRNEYYVLRQEDRNAGDIVVGVYSDQVLRSVSGSNVKRPDTGFERATADMSVITEGAENTRVDLGRVADRLPSGALLADEQPNSLYSYDRWLKDTSQNRNWTRNILETHILQREHERILRALSGQPDAYRLLYYFSAALLRQQEVGAALLANAEDVVVKAPLLTPQALEAFIRLGWVKAHPARDHIRGMAFCTPPTRRLLEQQQQNSQKAAALTCLLDSPAALRETRALLTRLQCRSTMPYYADYRGMSREKMQGELLTLAQRVTALNDQFLTRKIRQRDREFPSLWKNNGASLPIIMSACPFDPVWFDRSAVQRAIDIGVVGTDFRDRYFCSGGANKGWTSGYLLTGLVFGDDAGNRPAAPPPSYAVPSVNGLWHRQPLYAPLDICRGGLAYNDGKGGADCDIAVRRIIAIPQWGEKQLLEFTRGLNASFEHSGALRGGSQTSASRSPAVRPFGRGDGDDQEQKLRATRGLWSGVLSPADGEALKRLLDFEQRRKAGEDMRRPLRLNSNNGKDCDLPIRHPNGDIYCG